MLQWLGNWRFRWETCTDVKCHQFLLLAIENPSLLNTESCYSFPSLLSKLVSLFTGRAFHALCKGCVPMARLWKQGRHRSQADMNSLCWESISSMIASSRTHCQSLSGELVCLELFHPCAYFHLGAGPLPPSSSSWSIQRGGALGAAQPGGLGMGCWSSVTRPHGARVARCR